MSGSETTVQIRACNVWKKYGDLQVLKGLTLDIFQGETLVVLGRSGVGKSVLLRQIIGIEEPDEGFVEVEGVRTSHLSMAKRAKYIRHMGMLFQGAALFDSLSVGENTAFYLTQHPDPQTGKWVRGKALQEKVDIALSMVGLEGTQNKMPSELSGGMKKRAALARLIIYAPRILLFDEPTTGLDPITAMQINHLIVKIQKELNATNIVVTHDIKSAMTVGDRLAFHENGVIKEIGTKQAFVHSEDQNVRAFFENAILKEEMVF